VGTLVTDLRRESGEPEAVLEVDSQIKSRERVRDLAEVYTHEREVTAMLDFVSDMFEAIDSTFLEPACGNGNFLVQILARKLALVPNSVHDGPTLDFVVLRAVASIYAVDINEENVAEAHERMTRVVLDEFERRDAAVLPGLRAALRAILETNVVCGDALNGASEIQFVEWEVADGERFVRTPFPLEEPEHDLFYVPPEPLAATHYSELETSSDR